MEVFQSTLSVRRATRRVAIIDIGQRISIHALREESDIPQQLANQRHMISIHALREESDMLLVGDGIPPA